MKTMSKLLNAGPLLSRSMAMWFIVIAAMALGGVFHSVRADTIVSADQLSQSADVQTMTAKDGTVEGVVVNKSGDLLQDVKLLIRYDWLWKNEFSPGHNSPARATFYTLPEQIPPGQQVAFTYRPESPLPIRADGRFVTSVEVVGLTQFE